MARIAVKKSKGKFRLFCNTRCVWVSNVMSIEDLYIEMITTYEEFKENHSLAKEIIDDYSEDDDEFYSYKECNKDHKTNKDYKPTWDIM